MKRIAFYREKAEAIIGLMRRIAFYLFIVLWLVACSPAGAPADSSVGSEATVAYSEPTAVLPMVEPTVMAEPVTPTAVATTAPEPTVTTSEAPAEAEPTIAPPVEETAEPEVVMSGRIEAGAFFLGAADAPVTMIDYSDFL
jgi:hypothetical protein